MAQIGFLGLGTMGSGMVRNLLQAGHAVTVFNRSPERAEEVVGLGARLASSAAEAAQGADFLMYCFADDRAVEEVVLADGGVAEHVEPSTRVIDLSTISVGTALREHEVYETRGVRFLDAPVFGSRGEAAGGGLWVVVGGAEEDVEAARPVLEPISATLHHMGAKGSGARMKLVGNLLVASQLQALGDALTLARKSGLDLDAVLGVLDVADFRTPIYAGVGRRVLEGDYSPDFALKLLLKDLRLIAGQAQEVGIELPTLATTTDLAEAGVDQGWGEENASAVIKVLAERAQVDLTR
ncbi:NAD(P)-dependent oxidoreductase [Georgenia sp. 10Sc9-8]|uniref:NAD(P)-dependent oxidoreductase n=1 Tax=Georgenia halotolerans TaxID=3028317 RepID=A0ABT5TX97_9MICO|nr:NAD(P)-dependent oxidoreductase [Georgenia halotolerans]